MWCWPGVWCNWIWEEASVLQERSLSELGSYSCPINSQDSSIFFWADGTSCKRHWLCPGWLCLQLHWLYSQISDMPVYPAAMEWSEVMVGWIHTPGKHSSSGRQKLGLRIWFEISPFLLAWNYYVSWSFVSRAIKEILSVHEQYSWYLGKILLPHFAFLGFSQ